MTRLQNKKRSESTEQQLVISWARLQEHVHPELALLYHIPNGGSRNRLEAANLKRQGVKAGVPDLCLPVARGDKHGLYIEMKFGSNRTTDLQDAWLYKLKNQGYECAVCYGADAAITVIERYLGM